MATKQADPQFKLRLSTALKDKLSAAAAENKRSISAEILARLDASFEPEPRHIEWGRRLAAVEAQLLEIQSGSK
jgi:hypothetical protein